MFQVSPLAIAPMQIIEFIKSKVFLKHFGLAVLFTLVLIWFVMIWLSFYTNKGESFPAPNLKGLSISEVEKLMSKDHIRYAVGDSVYRKGVQPGIVVLQNPEAGHKIKPNRLIYLSLASNLPEQVEVPKVTDVSIRQARVLLESKGFALGNVEFRPSEFDDLVLEQKYNGHVVEPGTKLGNGATIDLIVGRTLNGKTFVPDLTGLTAITAKENLRKRALFIGATTYEPSVKTLADSARAIVWKQVPPADSTAFVQPGMTVDIWLKPEQADPAEKQ